MQHCAGFISAGSLYMFRAQAPIIRVFKTSTAELNSVPALIRRCDDLPATITHVPVPAVLVLNTPDDGRLRPKHVEWLCRNKTCTVLHQVGVSFDLYYNARKHKIKTLDLSNWLYSVIPVLLSHTINAMTGWSGHIIVAWNSIKEHDYSILSK